jgi:hypothetical protein
VGAPSAADFLQPGSRRLPPATRFTALDDARADRRQRSHGFTLDRDIGEFLLTHPNL